MDSTMRITANHNALANRNVAADATMAKAYAPAFGGGVLEPTKDLR